MIARTDPVLLNPSDDGNLLLHLLLPESSISMFCMHCRKPRHSYAAGERCAGYLWQALFGGHRQAARQMYNGCRGLTFSDSFQMAWCGLWAPITVLAMVCCC